MICLKEIIYVGRRYFARAESGYKLRNAIRANFKFYISTVFAGIFSIEYNLVHATA